MPTCTKCGVEKPQDAFRWLKVGRFNRRCKVCTDSVSKLWVLKNPERAVANTNRWAKENPERQRAAQLKYDLKGYGMTPEEYKNLHKDQDNRCAICQEVKKLCVDHCHKTKKIRGLLCHGCNKSLGLMRDSFSNLIRAANYIRRNSFCS